MKLNQKVRYGVGCLYELSKTPMEYSDAELVAKRQGIPLAYAHKILQSMSHAGLVFSQKGLGYRLARPLSSITAIEVIDLLTADVDPNASNPDIGVQLEKRIEKELGSFTLDELIAR